MTFIVTLHARPEKLHLVTFRAAQNSSLSCHEVGAYALHWAIIGCTFGGATGGHRPPSSVRPGAVDGERYELLISWPSSGASSSTYTASTTPQEEMTTNGIV